MRKILPLMAIGILVLSGLGAVVSSEENTDQKIILVNFSTPTIEEKDNYILVDMEETNTMLMKQGRPMVPSYIHTFTFPFGTQIKGVVCEATNIQEQVITKDLMLTPDMVSVGYPGGGDDPVPPENNEPYPDTWYDYEIYCGIRGNEQHIIVKVQVFPVQYDPEENMVSWASEVEITVEYDSPAQPMMFDDEYRLIVLGSDDFSDELAPLITHKNSNEVSTIFVSLDDIYGGTYFPVQGRDNQEKIKYFVKDAIENWGTSYVMLVGGSLKFPARETHVKAATGDSEIFVSDLYYADIYNGTGGFCSWDSNENDVFGEYDWGGSHLYDEVDLSPDVYLGRLACINGNEVTTAVNKIITYEEDEAYTQNWFTNLVVIGGDSFPGDEDQIDEGEYVNQAVIDIMDGFIPDKLWASLGRLSGIIPSGAQKINNAIDEGCGFVDFSGHGNTMIWATHPHEDDGTWLPTTYGGYLNSPHIEDLTNGDDLPIVITGACSVSKYNIDNDCFGWAWITNPNGGGIAHLGATGLGWAYTGEWVTEGLIEGIAIKTFEAYKDGGAITFGEMWGKAIDNYLFPSMEGVDYKTVEEWQPFGDPTLAVATESQPPAKPATPDGPTSGNVGTTYTYSSSTTDPDGDNLYYLFDWGDDTYSGWVGPHDSGDEAEASHDWTEQGSYEIKVKAKDDHGVQSEWSDLLPISMPKARFVHNPLLQQLFERFPNAFPILRHLFDL